MNTRCFHGFFEALFSPQTVLCRRAQKKAAGECVRQKERPKPIEAQQKPNRQPTKQKETYPNTHFHTVRAIHTKTKSEEDKIVGDRDEKQQIISEIVIREMLQNNEIQKPNRCRSLPICLKRKKNWRLKIGWRLEYSETKDNYFFFIKAAAAKIKIKQMTA